MDEKRERSGGFTVRSAIGFVVLFGCVSLLADMTYEGGRSLVGQYMKLLGAGATAVGVAAGAGELLGYVLRFASGYLADRTRHYWFMVIFGYCFQLFALPALAFTGRWEAAVLLVFAERIGKAIRNPSRDALLTYATSQTGRGFGFGLHEAMDQIGAFLGPVMLSLVLYFKGRAELAGGEIEGYRTGFLLLFIPACAAIVLVFILRALFPRPQDFELAVKTPRIAAKGYSKAYWYYLAAAALLAAGIADFPIIAYHFKKAEVVPAYWIPTLYALAMAVDALVFGVLYDRKGFPVLLGLFTLPAVTAPLVFLGGLEGAIVGMALWGTSMGAQESVMRAAIADLVPQDKRATAFGLFHTGFGVAWFLGSALMGILYDRNIAGLVVFSVAVQVAAIPVFLLANRAVKAAKDEEAEAS